MKSQANPKSWPTARLPLPPFGARLLDAIRRGEQTNTYIMAGPDAWNRYKIRTDRVVLPPDQSPDNFDWSLFEGRYPTIVADDSEQGRIKRLIWLLLRARVKGVCVIFDEGGVIHARHFR